MKGFVLLLSVFFLCTACSSHVLSSNQSGIVKNESASQDVLNQEIFHFEPDVVVSESYSCVDEDGGVNEFVRAKISNGSDEVFDSCLFSEKEGVRVPLDKLAEYSCENNNVVADIVSCEFGCESGSCRKSPRPKFSLVSGGNCLVNATFGSAIKVTQCFNDCLSQTVCEKRESKSSSVTLPWQLSCLVASEEWVVDRWVEFEVSRPVLVNFEVNVEGSEWVRVQIFQKGDWFVSSIIDSQPNAQNRCFVPFSGSAVVSLAPGKYEVRFGARAIGPNMLRSFKANDLSVSFI